MEEILCVICWNTLGIQKDMFEKNEEEASLLKAKSKACNSLEEPTPGPHTDANPL
jgi:hypothetical protein